MLTGLRQLVSGLVVPYATSLGVHVHSSAVVLLAVILHVVGHFLIILDEGLLESEGVSRLSLVWAWVSGWIMTLAVAVAIVGGILFYKRW